MNEDYLDGGGAAYTKKVLEELKALSEGTFEVTCEFPEGYKHPAEIEGRVGPFDNPLIRRIPKNFGRTLKVPAIMKIHKKIRGNESSLDCAVWEFLVYTDSEPHRAQLEKIMLMEAGDREERVVWRRG